MQESLDKANALIDKLGNDGDLTLIGRKLLSALSKAVDAGQQLIDIAASKNPSITKAAKTTLDEAIEMADNWVNQQQPSAVKHFPKYRVAFEISFALTVPSVCGFALIFAAIIFSEVQLPHRSKS